MNHRDYCSPVPGCLPQTPRLGVESRALWIWDKHSTYNWATFPTPNCFLRHFLISERKKKPQKHVSSAKKDSWFHAEAEDICLVSLKIISVYFRQWFKENSWEAWLSLFRHIGDWKSDLLETIPVQTDSWHWVRMRQAAFPSHRMTKDQRSRVYTHTPSVSVCLLYIHIQILTYLKPFYWYSHGPNTCLVFMEVIG